MDCVFCKIRDGQIPSTRVFEDERTIAFMDINPLNEGHCLVIPRAHAATLFEIDEADLQAAITTARRVAQAIRTAIRPDGMTTEPITPAERADIEERFAVGRFEGDARP